MYKINDYVVYNSMGVYQIVDIIRDRDFFNKETDYYVLRPVFSNNLIIKVPTDNPRIAMRSVISREDALALIRDIPRQETMWVENDRERSENFKSALRSGECQKWIRLVRTIYLEKMEKYGTGRKITKKDEEIMRDAERNLNEEFAVALNISPEEVHDFISRQLSDACDGKQIQQENK